MKIQVHQFLNIKIREHESLAHEIVALDKLNMETVLKDSGWKNFDWNSRFKSLTEKTSIVFVGYEENKVVGYLDIYVDGEVAHLSSIQIAPTHQDGKLFKVLLRSAYFWIKKENIKLLKSMTQRSNKRMLNLFKKLGFRLINTRHVHTLEVEAEVKEILRRSPFKQWDAPTPSNRCPLSCAHIP